MHEVITLRCHVPSTVVVGRRWRGRSADGTMASEKNYRRRTAQQAAQKKGRALKSVKPKRAPSNGFSDS
jgi:hypothetical protein